MAYSIPRDVFLLLETAFNPSALTGGQKKPAPPLCYYAFCLMSIKETMKLIKFALVIGG